MMPSQPKGVDPLERFDGGFRYRFARNAMEAIATGNEIAIDAMGLSILLISTKGWSPSKS